MPFRLIVFCALLLVASQAAALTIYKYTDANGVVTYTDKATAGAQVFVFRDRTAGETYGAGRFLYGEENADGTITLDFNCAFNPPCAFTDFAICPLPPRENRLSFPIRAGERKLD